MTKRTTLIVILLLLAWPATADEAAELRKRAQQVERRAEKLLDRGQRAEAFALLAEAADLRERALAAQARSGERTGDREAEQPPKQDAKPEDASGERAARQAREVLEAMDRALAGQNLAEAARLGRSAHDHLARWAARLETRERDRPPAPGDVEQRIERIERTVAALQRALQADR